MVRMIGYGRAHARLRQVSGPAKNLKCSLCTESARHWAYDHADANEIRNREGRAYSLDPSHYLPLCHACHTEFDVSFRRKQRSLRAATPKVAPPVWEPMMTTDDVAEATAVTTETVRDWARAGSLKGYSLPGGRWRFKPEDVQLFMEARDKAEVTP